MNIWRELGRLQVAARESERVDLYRGIDENAASERIAVIRRQMIQDQARFLPSTTSIPDFEDRTQLIVCGRVVRVPPALGELLLIFEETEGSTATLTAPELSLRLFKRNDRTSAVYERVKRLRLVLERQVCGLAIHSHHGFARQGYAFSATPLTLAQAKEAQSIAS